MDEKYEKQISDFLQRLNDLPKGERAVLKRSAGMMLHEADGRAMAAFYRCYPSKPEDKYFAAACIHCMWDWSAQDISAEPLQNILSKLRKDETLSESMQHRLIGILDTKWAEDGYLLTKLVRIIKMVKAKGYAVDCQALLDDLIHWNSENQYVQRNWARTFYQISQSNETEQ